MNEVYNFINKELKKQKIDGFFSLFNPVIKQSEKFTTLQITVKQKEHGKHDMIDKLINIVPQDGEYRWIGDWILTALGGWKSFTDFTIEFKKIK